MLRRPQRERLDWVGLHIAKHNITVQALPKAALTQDSAQGESREKHGAV